MMAPADMLENRVIVKQPGRYIGWPTIARTRDDELLVVFSGDRDEHVGPFGKTFLTRSGDNGETWSQPQLVNDTPLDDRDAGICACRDGTILVSWFTTYHDPEHMPWPNCEYHDRWVQRAAETDPADVDRWTTPCRCSDGLLRGHWTRRSSDGGQSWQEPIAVTPTTPHGPIELADGRLLFVGNDGFDHDGRTTAIVAAESSDKGQTWRVISRASMYPQHSRARPGALSYLCEPHVVEAADGRLVAMARYAERPYREGETPWTLWQFESNDGGRSWSQPRPTDILGKPPHLLRLSDGRLVVTYGYRDAPYGQRACLSADNGRTWDYPNEIVLRSDAPNGDLGYPSSVECPDGTILTVYYQIDSPGEKPCLMSTRWRPSC